LGARNAQAAEGRYSGESATTELKILISKARLKAHRFREAAQRAARLRRVE
jgi:hypothetical protein